MKKKEFKKKLKLKKESIVGLSNLQMNELKGQGTQYCGTDTGPGPVETIYPCGVNTGTIEPCFKDTFNMCPTMYNWCE